MTRKILFVINPASGEKSPILSDINESMNRYSIDWDVVITKKNISIKKQLSAKPLSSISEICIYGGDDTVHEVSSFLLGSKMPIYILHGGTANTLAHELDIPVDLQKALEILAHGRVVQKSIDSAYCNKELFFSASLIGPMSMVNTQTSREKKNVLGIVAYIHTFLTSIGDMKPTEFQITIGSKTIYKKGLGVLILNSQLSSFGGLKINSQASVSNGQLVVALIPKIEVSTFVEGIIHLAKNSYLDLITEYWLCKEATIVTENSTKILCDDSISEGTKVKLKIGDKKIKVLVPQQ